MSTTGKISQFASAPEKDPSSILLDLDLLPIQPFTDLSFDSLAHRVSLRTGLRKRTSISHMAHLGRPLFGSLDDAGNKAVREGIITFAATKLLNADSRKAKKLTNDEYLACLSQRIPLEFYSTTQAKQVEGHMRVCLKIEPSSGSMVTVSASEPLLSEAAYSIMSQESFDIPKAMESVLGGFFVDKGDRGEFLAMLFFTIARDQAVGTPNQYGVPTSRIIRIVPFLSEKLFQAPGFKQSIEADFPHGKMHFNHYVKVHDYAAIDAESLLLLFSRGAGVLCANNQHAIDGINPFLFKGKKLCLENLGLILWQAKNDPAFTEKPRMALFKAMDVYKLRILKKGDAAIPLIKVVFALAAKTPSLSIIRHPASVEYNAVIYEIWCAGISSKHLNVIDPLQERTWGSLLQASYGWRSIYEGPSAELLRSMNPGAALSIGHYGCWADRSDLQQAEED